MGLLKHENKSLNKDIKIEVKNSVNRKDVVGDPSEVTYPATIRVDNLTRNKLNSLKECLGLQSASDIVNSLVEQQIGLMDNAEKRRYERILNSYEQRDMITHSIK